MFKLKKAIASSLMIVTLGGAILIASPVFAVNRSTYSQGSTNDKKYGMGAYAAYWNNYGDHWAQVAYANRWGSDIKNAHKNNQAYAWLDTHWAERVNFFHGDGVAKKGHW